MSDSGLVKAPDKSSFISSFLHSDDEFESSNQSWKNRAKNLFSSAFFKPFLCVGVLFIIDSTYSGPYLTYMIDILDETGSNIDPDLGTVMVGSIRVIFAGTIQ